MIKPPGFKTAKRRLAGAEGNVTIMFALAAPLLFFTTAFAINEGNLTVVESKLNAAADDAALAALTPAMMQASDAVAQAAAVAMFEARESAVSTLVAQVVPTVLITHPNNNPLTRNVAVNYTVQTHTLFSGILNTSTMTAQGSSTAQATIPPNIDFYLLLDNSPSMSLPSTSAGITQMQNLTSKQYSGAGCAFACHQASTNNGDTAGNVCSDGHGNYSQPTQSSGQYCAATNAAGASIVQVDNYTTARLNSITLRLDALSTGVTTLMTTANNDQNSGLYAVPPVYRFSAYEMDQPWTVTTTNNLLMSLTTTFIQSWSTASASFGVMEMFANSVGCADSACDAGVAFNDVATNYDNALSDINNKMPNPGKGSNAPGDTPQEVMFFVTDGVEDEQNINRLIQPVNGNNGTNWCTQIKNRGIKIAILYTEYLPVPANSFYEDNVAPILPNVGPALQACASSGLYYDASFDTDLGQALAQLFNLAAQQAALLN